MLDIDVSVCPNGAHTLSALKTPQNCLSLTRRGCSATGTSVAPFSPVRGEADAAAAVVLEEAGKKMAKGKEIRLKVGKGTQRGDVSLSSFLPETVSLRVSYKGERAATVVLTSEQVEQLRQALNEIAPQGEMHLRLAA